VAAEAFTAGRCVAASSVGGLVDMVPAPMRVAEGDVSGWRRLLDALAADPQSLRPAVPCTRYSWRTVGAEVAGFLAEVVRSSPRQVNITTVADVLT